MSHDLGGWDGSQGTKEAIGFEVRVVDRLVFNFHPLFITFPFSGSPCFNVYIDFRKEALCCVQLGWEMNRSLGGFLFF